MYIIAIGWLWVAFMMAITEPGIVAGLLTFVFYGLLPCSLVLYLLGTPARRRRKASAEQQELPADSQGADPPDLAKPRVDEPG
jgi:membrane protein implicated in regulation of membrane protease activity